MLLQPSNIYQSQAEEPLLYNSRIIDNYIKLIKAKYSYINIAELLSYSGIETYQIADEGSWFTQSQINRFHHRLKKLTGNKEIAREAGRYSASPDALGAMRRYILGLIGPQSAYELSEKTAAKFTKSSTYQTKRVGSNKVEIKVTPNPGVHEKPFQCESRLGFFDAISQVFNYNLPKIEHPKCLFKGDKECLYIISWEKSRYAFWNKVRDITTLNLLIFFIFISLNTTIHISSLFFTTIIITILSLSIYIEKLKVKELREAVDNLSWTSEKLIEQININYENSLLVNDIGKVLTKENELEGLLSKVINVLHSRLDYDRGLILLANSNKTKLISRAGFGYKFDVLNKLMIGEGFNLDKEDSKGVFVSCFKEQKPFLVNDIDEIKDDLSARSLEFAKRAGSKSFICCPIAFEKESLGVLAVDNVDTKRPLVQRDINLLMGIAPQIALGIHNIRLVEARLRQFQSILHALVASTEARDPITAGHSERVTEYSVGVCKELGLPADYTDMIRVAASLHDYGKIGVDDAILKKPGRLTDEEYKQIKTHAEKSRKILERISFEGIYIEVPRVASSHHEKLDGSGYPDGLVGDEIPLGAQIIAVSDVFEALTSKRHYRDPMPVEEAFNYLVNNIGNHFNKKCVIALINHWNNTSKDKPYIYKDQFTTLDFKKLTFVQKDL